MPLFSYPSAHSGLPNLDKIVAVLVISLICMETALLIWKHLVLSLSEYLAPLIVIALLMVS